MKMRWKTKPALSGTLQLTQRTLDEDDEPGEDSGSDDDGKREPIPGAIELGFVEDEQAEILPSTRKTRCRSVILRLPHVLPDSLDMQ